VPLTDAKDHSPGANCNLDEAIPLCHFHHQRIHDHSYTHRSKSDGAITFRQTDVHRRL
jgi:hypothetical protein